MTRDSVRLVPSAAAAGHPGDDAAAGMMLDAGTPIDASQPAPGPSSGGSHGEPLTLRE